MSDPLYRPYLDVWPYSRRRDIRRGLKIVTLATGEPIDLATAQLHLRLTTTGSPPSNPDDSLITSVYLPAAREACEQYLGVCIAPQTLELTLGPEDRGHAWSFGAWGFGQVPATIELPFGPLRGVESVSYLSAGVATPFTAFDADTYTDRIRIKSDATWPTSDNAPNALVIRYQAGYSLPGDSPQDDPLPPSIRAAVLLTLSQIYDNCQNGTICDISDLPAAVKYLLDPFGRRRGFA